MLAIANLGKFLAELLRKVARPILRTLRRLRTKLRRNDGDQRARDEKPLVSENGQNHNHIEDDVIKEIEKDDSHDGGGGGGGEGDDDGDGEKSAEEEEEEMTSSGEAVILFISFLLYIIIGSAIIITYERDMDLFMAVYFNFVTLTTIARLCLGDLVPRSESGLPFTLLYCAVGLALTTIAIEIAADFLKQLHYFGRKIENVSKVKIWFGGKQLTMKQLVKNLGDQLNVPLEQMQNLLDGGLDQFVNNAIKVEAGELTTLRASPRPSLTDAYNQAIASFCFVDEDELLTIQSYPSAHLAATRLPSRSISPPLVAVIEHVPFSPSPPPPPPPDRCDAKSVAAASIVSHVPFAPMPDVQCQVPQHYEDNGRYADLMAEAKRRRKEKQDVTDSSKRKNYSEEARKRYEAYQQQWQKFRATRAQNEDDSDETTH